MARTTFAPRIYVSSLSDYNAGNLHGVWIDADQSADDIRAEIAAMLRDSKYPNVEVDCPQCDGRETVTFHNSETGDTRQGECPTCKGTGSVPSAEEWVIHDSDDFGGLKIGENESIDTVADLAAALAEHGEPWAKWYENENRSDADTDGFRDAYRGHYDSLADYAEEYCDDCMFDRSTPAVLKQYFDFERFANDMERGGDIWSAEADGGGVYVYGNN